VKVARVFYVAGYGRSGSTLLDTLLGNCPGYWGIGEASNLFEAATRGEGCSCGRPLRDCPMWGKELAEVLDFESLKNEQRQAEGLSGLRNGVAGSYYTKFWTGFLARRALHDVVVVDSSKTSRSTVSRPLQLGRLGAEVTIVHLTREPESLLSSLMKGSNKELAQRIRKSGVDHVFLLRSFIGALFANLAAIVLGRVIFRRYVHVRYEDLIHAPVNVLSRLGVRGGQALDISALSTGHAVSGNRMRHANSLISIDRNCAANAERKADVPRFYSLLFGSLGLFSRERHQ